MRSIRILFSNQPLAYREAMAAVVQKLRPAAEVTVGDPGNLDAEIARVQPQLVICDGLATSVRQQLCAWVVLYPGGQNVATYSIGGEERQLPGIDLSELLSVVDAAATYVHSLSGIDPPAAPIA